MLGLDEQIIRQQLVPWQVVTLLGKSDAVVEEAAGPGVRPRLARLGELASEFVP